MRFLFNKVTLSVGVLLILGTLGLGEFIFWRVLKVSCSNDQVIESNTPRYFVADGRDQGPFSKSPQTTCQLISVPNDMSSCSIHYQFQFLEIDHWQFFMGRHLD